MARIVNDDITKVIVPGSDIIVGNNQGDAYYYRKQTTETQADPRSEKNGKPTPQDKIGMAGQIYSKKPNCWRDHFFRSTKIYTYGNRMDDSPVRELSGFQLAMSMLVNSFNYNDGTYYNPRCFCIQPTDMLGQEVGSNGHLKIKTSTPLKYLYDEEHQLLVEDPDPEKRRNPFCSAVNNPLYPFDEMLLEVQNMTPYYSFPHWKEIDLKGTHNLCCTFPIHLERHNDPLFRKVPLEEKESWIYEALGQIGVDNYGSPIIGMSAEFQDPFNDESLCGMGSIALGLSYSKAGLTLATIDHQVEPSWDLFYNDEFICNLGVGGGPERKQTFYLGNNYISKDSSWTREFYEQFKPLKTGRQPYHKKINRIMTAFLKGVSHGSTTCTGHPLCADIMASCEPPCDGANQYGYDWVVYDYVLPYPVYFNQSYRDPQIKITLCKNIYNDEGFQAWYPNGAIIIYVSEDRMNWSKFHVDFRHIEIDPSLDTYCLNFNAPTQFGNYIRIYISNGTVFRNCTKSRVSLYEPPVILQRMDLPELKDYFKTHREWDGKFLLTPEEKAELEKLYDIVL